MAVIVINQKADNGEPINQPLLIPEKILTGTSEI